MFSAEVRAANERAEATFAEYMEESSRSFRGDTAPKYVRRTVWEAASDAKHERMFLHPHAQYVRTPSGSPPRKLSRRYGPLRNCLGGEEETEEEEVEKAEAEEGEADEPATAANGEEGEEEEAELEDWSLALALGLALAKTTLQAPIKAPMAKWVPVFEMEEAVPKARPRVIAPQVGVLRVNPAMVRRFLRRRLRRLSRVLRHRGGSMLRRVRLARRRQLEWRRRQLECRRARRWR